MLVIARSGAGMGRAVVTPTHNSLLSDYYPAEVRADVFGFHRMANALGAFIGPVVGGRPRRGLRMARALLRVRDPVDRVRGARHAAEGARPRPPRATGGRRHRGGHRHRRATTVVGRVRPDPLADPHAAPDLVLAAVPRRVGDRPGLAHLALLRGGLQPLRVAARLRRRRRRARPGRRHPHRHPAGLAAHAARSRDSGSACCRLVAVGIAGAWVAFALAPVLGRRDRRQRPDHRHGRAPRRRASSPRCRWPSRRRCDRSGSRWLRCSSCPG